MRRLAALAALVLAGCGGETATERPPDATTFTTTTQPQRARAAPAMPRCPAALDNCERARGRIVYVEAVDADGDGDAHFVLASRQSITFPGISVIAVVRDLRPKPLPEVGDELAAAGPVYNGRFGQRQIEAIEVRVRRR